MERDNHSENDLVDLGAVTEETKGGQENTLDSSFTMQRNGGIADD